MEFRVSDLIKIELLKNGKLLGGDGGLQNEIKGVTIIEAPDIARFINGGEVLLTGLYAFKSCTEVEFGVYIQEFFQKRISALILKRGRDVAFAAGKITRLNALAKQYEIPVLEIPFEVSFRDIMCPIMEHLFNEEVTRLKYFKTTHDNFVSLSLSESAGDKGIENIANLLGTLIGNPVSVFNQSLSCIFTTTAQIQALTISKDARECDMKPYANYVYLEQFVSDKKEKDRTLRQSIIRLRSAVRRNIYLVITELNRPIDTMDYIAIENAITALKMEFSKQNAMRELEQRYRNDIINDILYGKIHSMQKLKQSAEALGLSVDAQYRVLLFSLTHEQERNEDYTRSLELNHMLYDAVAPYFSCIKVQSDLNHIAVIQEADAGQKREVYRKEIKIIAEKIEKNISKVYPGICMKVGIGGTAEGIQNIHISYKEAGDTLLLADIAGEKQKEGRISIAMASDLGVFKLLFRLEDPDMMLEFIPESLQKLYNYKKPQKNDLIITLKTYLDHNQNLTKTAQDLFIHYKTAVYRMERIGEITGIDFDNANEVLSVKMGLIIYKMIENYKLDTIN